MLYFFHLVFLFLFYFFIAFTLLLLLLFFYCFYLLLYSYQLSSTPLSNQPYSSKMLVGGVESTTSHILPSNFCH